MRFFAVCGLPGTLGPWTVRKLYCAGQKFVLGKALVSRTSFPQDPFLSCRLFLMGAILHRARAERP